MLDMIVLISEDEDLRDELVDRFELTFKSSVNYEFFQVFMYNVFKEVNPVTQVFDDQKIMKRHKA